MKELLKINAKQCLPFHDCLVEHKDHILQRPRAPLANSGHLVCLQLWHGIVHLNSGLGKTCWECYLWKWQRPYFRRKTSMHLNKAVHQHATLPTRTMSWVKAMMKVMMQTLMKRIRPLKRTRWRSWIMSDQSLSTSSSQKLSSLLISPLPQLNMIADHLTGNLLLPERLAMPQHQTEDRSVSLCHGNSKQVKKDQRKVNKGVKGKAQKDDT